MTHAQDLQPYEYFLKPGYIVANSDDTVIRAVLGNCVAVTLYDRENRFGGMNHYLFPESRERRQATARFGNIAIPTLFRLLVDMGADRTALEAQIVGGAEQHDLEDEGLGERNIEIARRTLCRLGVPVASEDVGGVRGRKLIYHTGTNETVIYKVDKIRDSDWFLPGHDPRFSTSR